MSSMPTGNGQIRGPEDTSPLGHNLPGTRPERAAANNARNRDFLGWPADPKEQAGFGTEDMVHGCDYMGSANLHAADQFPPPDLASMGDGGQTFGGS